MLSFSLAKPLPRSGLQNFSTIGDSIADSFNLLPLIKQIENFFRLCESEDLFSICRSKFRT